MSTDQQPKPRVSVAKAGAAYPTTPPWHPTEAYPEYTGPVADPDATGPNEVYAGVRKALELLGYDQANQGTPEWNPLGHLIEPGQTVFIKPNLVDHKHRFDGDLWSVITHPSVVRAVADYAAIALKGEGRILIGDNPHVDTQWDQLAERWHFDAIEAHLKETWGVDCQTIDLRFWHMPDLKYYGFKHGVEPLSGDPKGFSTVDIGENSLLQDVPIWLLRGTFNDRFETIRHHRGGKHEYTFANSLYSADVFISIPKLKAHAKVGVTLNLKGLIGTITNKNVLVHWRIGFPALGGDEYPTPDNPVDYLKLYWQHAVQDVVPSGLYFHLRNFLNGTPVGRWYNPRIKCEAQRKRMLRGAWDGNDTTWRMTVDVYRAFVRDAGGNRAKRGYNARFFSLVDGIVGGDTDGPHFPHPTNPGLVVAGEQLLDVDLVCTRLMDFDPEQVRYLSWLRQQEGIDYEALTVASDVVEGEGFFERSRRYLGYRPPHRWPKLSLGGLKPGPSYLPL